MGQDDWRPPEGGTGDRRPEPRAENTKIEANPSAPPPSEPPPLPSNDQGEATQVSAWPPAFGSPAPPAYGTPAPPGYGTPAPPAYGTPAPPAYGSPAPPAYGSPAPPGYGTPSYGTPPPYGAGYPPYQGYAYPRARTSGFAIASFVLSLVWMFWLGSLLAVVFGHVALSEIKRNPGVGGRGLAIAGLVIGYAALALLLLALLFSPSSRQA
jgi:Domain of unknown function (DUF4190)